MNDQEHADNIRAKINELRKAIEEAEQAGLAVTPPLMLNQWLMTGHAPGEPAYWKIKRRTL
jgi:hypothetical protein